MYDNSNNQHGREKVDAMATMPLPMEIFSSLYEVSISYDFNSRLRYQEIDFQTAPKWTVHFLACDHLFSL